MISSELLEVLHCPIGKAPLRQADHNLVCSACGAAFPVKDGIPILLIDEAILPDGVNDISELKCLNEKDDP